MHALTCACILSASNDDNDDELSTESLLKKICVPLCMPWSAPECSSEHLKLPKFPGGACLQTLLYWTAAGHPCSLLWLMTLPPYMEKVMYGPGHSSVPSVSPPASIWPMQLGRPSHSCRGWKFCNIRRMNILWTLATYIVYFNLKHWQYNTRSFPILNC